VELRDTTTLRRYPRLRINNLPVWRQPIRMPMRSLSSRSNRSVTPHVSRLASRYVCCPAAVSWLGGPMTGGGHELVARLKSNPVDERWVGAFA
jgi:hypothetical protein